MDDIKTKKDIAHFVNTFYQGVQEDELIGPVFNQHIKPDQWPRHLERMVSFWTTVLLHKKDYRGNPFAHHIKLDIDKAHFDRWVNLFSQTITESFAGPKANEALDRAEKMRIMFETKLKYIRDNPVQHPIM